MKKMCSLFLFTLFFVILVPVLLFAQDVLPTVAEYSFTDLFSEVSTLVTEWKSLGLLGGIVAIISITVKILKSSLIPDSWFSDYSKLVKRFIIVLLGQVLSIFILVTSGTGWLAACIAGLVTSGGAIAIYHALKPLFKK